MEDEKKVTKWIFNKEKVEKSIPFMWIMLIVFAPCGAYLMWANKRYNIVVRILITIVFMLWYFFIVGYTKNAKGQA